MHGMQCRIGSKSVVNIVRRPYRRIQVQISHIEGIEFVFERDLCGCKSGSGRSHPQFGQ